MKQYLRPFKSSYLFMRRIKLLIPAAFLLATVFFVSNVNSAEVSLLFSKELPNIPGIVGEILTVKYAPGASSSSHRHDANVFVYVLEGSVIMQVKGGEMQTLVAGDTFYETPDDIHTVSRNASETESATILVFFVKGKGNPATTPVP